MALTSFGFLGFLVATYALFGLVLQRAKLKPIFISITSLFFYSFFGLKNLLILVICLSAGYVITKIIQQTSSKLLARVCLVILILLTVGALLCFKFYSITASQLITSGIENDLLLQRIVLPVGMSFYLFRIISHGVDVFRLNTKFDSNQGTTTDNNMADPGNQLQFNFIDYTAYITFFPQLISGPLMRARDFYEDLRNTNYKIDFDSTSLLFLSGFLKKLVIASILYEYIKAPFQVPENYASLDLIAALLVYSAYIFMDFSGYSDLANGISQLFGFRYIPNFAGPYGSKGFGEFWRRWHISLSLWFRDYVYIPLGGDGRFSQFKRFVGLRNAFLVMVISGIWHGAGLGFLVWGVLHGIGIVISSLISPTAQRFLPEQVDNQVTKKSRNLTQTNNIKLNYTTSLVTFCLNSAAIVTTFLLVSFLWIFFATPSLGSALEYLKAMSNFSSDIPLQLITNYVLMSIVLFIFLTNVWYLRLGNFIVTRYKRLHFPIKLLVILLAVTVISLTKPAIVPPYVYQNF